MKQHFSGAADIHDTDAHASAVVCRKLMPDILLLDVDVRQGVGLELASQLVRDPAKPSVIVVTGKSEPNLLNLLIEIRAAGYLTKSCSEDDLLNAVSGVSEGERYISEEFSQIVIQGKIEGLETPALGNLSRREMEVLISLAEGRSPEEIAETLSISPKTVASYKKRIHEKLNTRNNADIARLAIRSGLLTST